MMEFHGFLAYPAEGLVHIYERLFVTPSLCVALAFGTPGIRSSDL
jgi:hypothetical protein